MGNDLQCTAVGNEKTHLALFETCVFLRISPELRELRKIYYHLFASLSEEVSDEKEIKSSHKISRYLQKPLLA